MTDQREELLTRLGDMYGPWKYVNPPGPCLIHEYKREGASGSDIFVDLRESFSQTWRSRVFGKYEVYSTAQEAMTATDAWLLSQGKVLIGGVP